MDILAKIIEIYNEVTTDTDCFLVEALDKGNQKYQLLVDADTNFGINEAVRINRKMRKLIEENGVLPEGEYELEVSSPGIDAPLKLQRQYLKNIGRLVEVAFVDKEKKAITGRLTAWQDDNLELSIEDKKKKTSTTQQIAVADIKTTTVQIEF
jgi:ribosome maturation factor RimP